MTKRFAEWVNGAETIGAEGCDIEGWFEAERQVGYGIAYTGRQGYTRTAISSGSEQTLSKGQVLFCEGFTLYQKKDFEAAARCFEKGLDSDPVCRVFLDRCQHFMTFPPDEKWDGVWASGE